MVLSRLVTFGTLTPPIMFHMQLLTNILEELSEPDRQLEDTGTAFCGELGLSTLDKEDLTYTEQAGFGTFYVWVSFSCDRLEANIFEGHHQFLNYCGLPEARLIRTHSVNEKGGNQSVWVIMAIATMASTPLMVLGHIEKLCVDGIINTLDVRAFVDNFDVNNTRYSTFVSPPLKRLVEQASHSFFKGKCCYGSQC